MGGTDGGWDIGGYVPSGYAITPWAVLFPALAERPKETSLKNIYFAKLFTYYLTRMHFLQYLTFLQDVGEGFCGNEAIQDDVMVYRTLCDELLSSVRDLQHATLDDGSLSTIAKTFEASMGGRFNGQPFYSGKVYQRFFESYGFWYKCGYGFVVVFKTIKSDDPFRYPRYDPSTPAGRDRLSAPIPSSPFTLRKMLGDAIRIYPVINMDGTGQFVWFPVDKWVEFRGRTFISAILDGHMPPAQCHEGFDYFDIANPFEECSIPTPDGVQLEIVRLFPVGANAVPDNYDGRIRGRPFLTSLPFDFLQDFARGKGR
jgi:hypothetical protein